MFAILIEEKTLELITAINEGLTPEIGYDDEGAPNTFYVWHDHNTPAAIISKDTMCEMVGEDVDWEASEAAFWRR